MTFDPQLMALAFIIVANVFGLGWLVGQIVQAEINKAIEAKAVEDAFFDAHLVSATLTTHEAKK